MSTTYEIMALSSIIDKIRLMQEYNKHLGDLEEEIRELADNEDLYWNYKYVKHWFYCTEFTDDNELEEYLKEMTDYKEIREDEYKKKHAEAEKKRAEKKAIADEIQRRLDEPHGLQVTWEDK